MIDKIYSERIASFLLNNILDIAPKTHYLSDCDRTLKDLYGKAVTILWEQLMIHHCAYSPLRPALAAEKALACLIRRGLEYKHLQIKLPRIRVKLDNFAYYIDKTEAGCCAGPASGEFLCRCITLSGEDFAEFLFDFDNLAGAIIKRIDEAVIGYQAKKLQYKIICQTMDILGKQYLEPYGISFSVQNNFSERDIYVTFFSKSSPPVSRIIPFDDITESFIDIALLIAVRAI